MKKKVTLTDFGDGRGFVSEEVVVKGTWKDEASSQESMKNKFRKLMLEFDPKFFKDYPDQLEKMVVKLFGKEK